MDNATDKSQLRSILVVEDDENFRQVLVRILSSENFYVYIAKDGKAAIDQGLINKVEVILSDIKMPNMSGIELLTNVRKVNAQVPFVLMTAFTDVIEVANAYKLGANEFLCKPFKKNKLLSTLQAVLEGKKNYSAGLSNEKLDWPSRKYYNLAVEDFCKGAVIKFPIFIKLSDKKFINIGHEGEDLDKQRIDFLKKKGIQFLYIQQSDYLKYLGFDLFTDDQNDQADKKEQDNQKDQKDPKNKKSKSKFKPKPRISNLAEQLEVANRIEQLVQGVFKIFPDYSYQGKLNLEVINQRKTEIENCLHLLLTKEKIFNLIDDLEKNFPKLYQHSIGVIFLALAISKKVKEINLQELYRIVIAGLLHDIGLKDVWPLIGDASLAEMREDEFELYRQHPLAGATYAKTLGIGDDQILQLISQHHELLDGDGYPQKLKRDHLHSYSTLLGIAEEFCSFTKGGDQNLKEFLSPREALGRISEIENAYPKSYLDAIKQLFI